MEFDEFIELYMSLLKKNAEEQLWEQWLVDYSRMNSDTFISFSEYKIKAFNPIQKTESNKKVDIKKIIEDAEKIKKIDQMGR
jgi:hypothetical protein